MKQPVSDRLTRPLLFDAAILHSQKRPYAVTRRGC